MLIHPLELPVYQRLDFAPVRGEGCRLWDASGRCFLDFYGGHAVALTGHCHPRVVAALREQAGRLLFYSNALPLAARERFLDLLGGMLPAGLERVLLVNSGAEANEQALALARRATGRGRVVALEGGFHGRTLATLALSGLERYRRLAETSPAGRALTAFTDLCAFDDAGALERLVGPETAAVIVEPVQGLGGARAASPAFLHAARRICDRSGAALLFDEIQCGCGRSGAFTAAQRHGVLPDGLTLAKGIAAGLPMGLVAVGARLAAGVGNGELGTTFGGGPIAAAAGAANLEALQEEDLAGRAAAMEQVLRARLAGLPGLLRVRGLGLLLGLEFAGPARPIQERLFAAGILAGSSADPGVLRLLPPLVVTEAEIEEFAGVLSEVLHGA